MSSLTRLSSSPLRWEVDDNFAIVYDPADAGMTLLAGFLGLAPFVAFAVVVLFVVLDGRQDAMALGLALSTVHVVTTVLKNVVVRQPRPPPPYAAVFVDGPSPSSPLEVSAAPWRCRPPPASAAAGYHEGYGMPSAHAAFMFALCMFCLLQRAAAPARDRRLRATVGISVLAVLAAAVAWARVYAGHHTWEQVGAGALVGTGLTILLRAASLPMRALFDAASRRLLDHLFQPVCRWLALR